MPIPKLRHVEARHGHLTVMPQPGAPGARRTVITLGELVAAAYGVAKSTEGTARLLGEASPLAHFLDRRIVIH
jgi:hypothetical protein